MKCVEVYKELYHQEPFDVAFCPYRISPLGAHTAISWTKSGMTRISLFPI